MDPDLKVPFKTLLELPRLCSVIGNHIVKDQRGKMRDALIVMWDHPVLLGTDMRKASFAVDNGEYLGEEL